jgi:broad specificity phosphatase PhoE
MTHVDLQLWLMRHGETEWSLSGAHTSRTDIPLTARGKERAEKIRDYLAHRKFSLVLTSPMQRARETCRIAGYGDVAQIDDNLREWDYGI